MNIPCNVLHVTLSPNFCQNYAVLLDLRVVGKRRSIENLRKRKKLLNITVIFTFSRTPILHLSIHLFNIYQAPTMC